MNPFDTAWDFFKAADRLSIADPSASKGSSGGHLQPYDKALGDKADEMDRKKQSDKKYLAEMASAAPDSPPPPTEGDPRTEEIYEDLPDEAFPQSPPLEAPKSRGNPFTRSEPFDAAWALLKARPEHQLVSPRQVDTQGPGWYETSSRFMPQGALHPAIRGMMERRGIQQPNIGQYERGTYSHHDTVNPVTRMEGNLADDNSRARLQGDNRRTAAPTYTGPAFHGEQQTWFGEPGETQAPFIGRFIDPSVRDAQPVPLESLQGAGIPEMPQIPFGAGDGW